MNNRIVKIFVFIFILMHLSFHSEAQVFQNDTLYFCKADSALLDAGGNYNSYLWNTAETTSSIYAKYSGMFKVSVKDNVGNQVVDSVYVSLGNHKLMFVDTTACYGDSLEIGFLPMEPVTLVGYYPFTEESVTSSKDFGDYSIYDIPVNTLYTPSYVFMNGIEDGSTAVALSKETFFIYVNDTNYFSRTFSLHCWLNPDSLYGVNGGLDSTFYIFNSWKPFDSKNMSENAFALTIDSHGKLAFRTSDGVLMNEFVVDDEYALAPSKWAMVDVVCAMGNLSIYINSQKVLSKPIDVYPQRREMYYIGSTPSYNYNYAGGLADLRIYKSDLSQEQIANLYEYNTTYRYEYDWSSEDGPMDLYDRTINVMPTDTLGEYYYVRLTNELGNWPDTACYRDSVFVKSFPEIVIELEQVSMGCPETNEGGFITNISGGVIKSDTSNVATMYDIQFPRGYPSIDSLGWVMRLPKGTFTVTVEDSVGCVAEQTIDIETYPEIQDSIQVEPSVIYRQRPQAKFSVTFNQECYITDYYWEFGDGNTSREAEIEHNYGDIPEDVTSFVIKSILTDDNGCIDSTTVTIPVKEATLNIPNVFTPNGDGVNEDFRITIADDEERLLSEVFESNTLTVYNRQGRIVFQKDNYESGEFDGKNLSDGVYFYILQCRGQIKTETYNGYVHIFRGSLE